MFNQTITLTAGDRAENHTGMQQIGQGALEGFTVGELQTLSSELTKQELKCELIDLTQCLPAAATLEQLPPPAAVLVIRNFVSTLLQDSGYTLDDLWREQSGLEPDTQAFMYGRVVNKHARYNLCFAPTAQQADLVNRKGTIVAFSQVPVTQQISQQLPHWFGNKARDLVMEGNYYYDPRKCGIGYHGDSERKLVIGIRLGQTMPLRYQWFRGSQPVGIHCEILLNHGDVYIMSAKAVGSDWKSRHMLTLRHAAGAPKFLLNPLLPKKNSFQAHKRTRKEAFSGDF